MYHMPSSSHAEGGFELSVFLPGLRVTQLLTFGCGTAAVYSGILLVERAGHAAFFFFFKLNYLNVCFYCMFFLDSKMEQTSCFTTPVCDLAAWLVLVSRGGVCLHQYLSGTELVATMQRSLFFTSLLVLTLISYSTLTLITFSV